MELRVNTSQRNYPIYIENNLRKNFAQIIHQSIPLGKLVILSDDNVAPLYAEDLMTSLEDLGRTALLHVLPHGETSKHWNRLAPIYQWLSEEGVSRTDTIIALGGGVIGDLAGFVAASYLRGLNFIQIPTSLLAQVDSSVGGKVGVDIDGGKNLVGAYKQPHLVLIDPLVLNSLSDHYFKDGLGEIVKYACIADSELFTLLEGLTSRQDFMEQAEAVIYRCCAIKAAFVEKDEFDGKERMALNFGHSLAHALEAYTDYLSYSHGQAVVMGMVETTLISQRLGLSEVGLVERLVALLQQLGLSYDFPIKDFALLAPYMAKDKKNLNGKLNEIIVPSIGHYQIYPTDLEFFNPLP
ncbi:3-dehydroquinate synthase [Granulicatella seriolae]|uniref:3-dehydroquinate synthase n=1 Tax=Granulicatella seriolae TaxID=2967226 RepID=A0ABT1WNR5_9LACT|nr:3-dehydroquinate synthase [Granulicatella seriolae]